LSASGVVAAAVDDAIATDEGGTIAAAAADARPDHSAGAPLGGSATCLDPSAPCIVATPAATATPLLDFPVAAAAASELQRESPAEQSAGLALSASGVVAAAVDDAIATDEGGTIAAAAADARPDHSAGAPLGGSAMCINALAPPIAATPAATAASLPDLPLDAVAGPELHFESQPERSAGLPLTPSGIVAAAVDDAIATDERDAIAAAAAAVDDAIATDERDAIAVVAADARPGHSAAAEVEEELEALRAVATALAEQLTELGAEADSAAAAVVALSPPPTDAVVEEPAAAALGPPPFGSSGTSQQYLSRRYVSEIAEASVSSSSRHRGSSSGSVSASAVEATSGPAEHAPVEPTHSMTPTSVAASVARAVGRYSTAGKEPLVRAGLPCAGQASASGGSPHSDFSFRSADDLPLPAGEAPENSSVDELTKERREFEAWLDRAVRAAAELLDERDHYRRTAEQLSISHQRGLAAGHHSAHDSSSARQGAG